MGKTEKKRKENHATDQNTKNQQTKIWDERNIRGIVTLQKVLLPSRIKFQEN